MEDTSTDPNSCATDTVAPEPAAKPPTRRQIVGLARANKAKNAEFQKASRAEKRVMIARDVLSALTRGKIEANAGAYVEPSDVYDYDDVEDIDGATAVASKKDSLQELLENVTPCKVCAKGAIFLCTVAMRNQVTVGDFQKMSGEGGYAWNTARRAWKGTQLSKTLGGIFSPKQLATIENEFEGTHMDKLGPKPVMQLEERFPYEEKARLRVIFRNIIRNNGTFKPVKAMSLPSYEL